MGVRTQISLKEVNNLIPKDISFKELKQTRDGISDSTYIGKTKNNEKCIFKIYEFASIDEVKNEMRILKILKDLETPKPLIDENQINIYKNKPVAIYSYLEGESYDNPSIKQIKEIGLFLGKFHFLSKDLKSINKNIYSQKQIEIFIDKISKFTELDTLIKQSFINKYQIVKNLSLDENCVIHGDLFPDNAKFIGDKLSGVFDFVEACNGHYFFDLAVVINSWCFNKYELDINKFNAIIEKYNKNSPQKVVKEEIKKYMMYASLFYACQRFNTKFIEKRNVNVKDYNEYLNKFENIEKYLLVD